MIIPYLRIKSKDKVFLCLFDDGDFNGFVIYLRADMESAPTTVPYDLRKFPFILLSLG